jgi:hypothetical protein
MPPTDDFKINLNQNLWGLVVALGFLGAAEFYDLGTLWSCPVSVDRLVS